MSEYPQQYYYYPVEYQPQFWPQLIGFLTNVIIVIALTSTVIATTKKALAGEEVEL